MSRWLGSGGERQWPQWHLRDLDGDCRAAIAIRGLMMALLLSSAIITGLSVQEPAADQSHESKSLVLRDVAQAISMTEAGIVRVKLDVVSPL